jgi:hypothetical protein
LEQAQRSKRRGNILEEIPQDQPPIAISISTMTAIGSAISDLYKTENMAMSEDLKSEMTKFMKRYRRTINQMKQRGNGIHCDYSVGYVKALLIHVSEMAVYEGKRPIRAKGYALASIALKSTANRLGSVYTHIFTILCWNLFERSCNVGKLMLHHISWVHDNLKIVLPKHKGDQEGTRIYPKHIYAKPLRPKVCPILALALYVFSRCVLMSENTTR